MKKMMLVVIFMLPFFMLGCSFFVDKPSDSQIKRDVSEYFSSSKYNPLHINNIYIKGIIFTKDKDIVDKIAVAIVRVEAEFKADYLIPAKMSLLDALFEFPTGLDKNHKKGDIIIYAIQQKYCRSDRAWLPYKIEGRDVREAKD